MTINAAAVVRARGHSSLPSFMFYRLFRRPVAQIDVVQGAVTGVTFADGRQMRAKAVMVNADPFRIQELVGAQHLPPELNARLDSQKIDGSVLKASYRLFSVLSCVQMSTGSNGTVARQQQPHRLSSPRCRFDCVTFNSSCSNCCR